MRDAITKLLRGRHASALLRAFGIDPRRYWLLMDLFDTLSERGEMMDQLGRSGVALSVIAKVYCGFSALFTLLFIAVKPPLEVYLGIFLFFTGFLLASVLLSETANSLINPTEGLILAHQPIDGATYTAAKLSHLLRIVAYMVPAANLVPAFAGLLLKRSSWPYPLLHMAAAFTLGLIVALLCCALFGWLIRFVPPRRLKATGQFASSLLMLGMMWMPQLRKVLARIDLAAWLPAQPAARWALGVAAFTAIVATVALGIRALSADYLIRVSAMTRGGASAGSRVRPSRIGAIVSRLFGGQPARAGFAFVSRMMLRDWQFRRQFVPMLVLALISAGGAALKGWPADPFSRGAFSPAHLLPHAIAYLVFLSCAFMPYSNDHKGAWIFLLAPSRAIDRFARGIHALLWIALVVVPHLSLLPLLAWRWGAFHAALFIAFSFAAASTYLALGLRLVRQIPFSTQVNPARGTLTMLVMMVGMIAIAIAIGVQYFYLFRSPFAVALTAVALGVAAWYLTRASVRAMGESFRFHLGLASQEITPLYTEIGN